MNREKNTVRITTEKQKLVTDTAVSWLTNLTAVVQQNFLCTKGNTSCL